MEMITRKRLFKLLDAGHSIEAIAEILDKRIDYLAYIMVTPVKELTPDEKIDKFLRTAQGVEFHIDYPARQHSGGIDYYEDNPPKPFIAERITFTPKYFTKETVHDFIAAILDRPDLIDMVQNDGYEFNDRVLPDSIHIRAKGYKQLFVDKS